MSDQQVCVLCPDKLMNFITFNPNMVQCYLFEMDGIKEGREGERKKAVERGKIFLSVLTFPWLSFSWLTIKPESLPNSFQVVKVLFLNFSLHN